MTGAHSGNPSSLYLCEMKKTILGRSLCVGHNWFRQQEVTKVCS